MVHFEGFRCGSCGAIADAVHAMGPGIAGERSPVFARRAILLAQAVAWDPSHFSRFVNDRDCHSGTGKEPVLAADNMIRSRSVCWPGATFGIARFRLQATHRASAASRATSIERAGPVHRGRPAICISTSRIADWRLALTSGGTIAWSSRRLALFKRRSATSAGSTVSGRFGSLA
jgi:hypothetical protein